MRPRFESYPGDGRRWPALVWRLPRPLLAISSAPLGGGLARCSWVINAQVPRGYDRMDPDRHLEELAASFGLVGPGVGLLTAADVGMLEVASDEGVTAVATVGLARPTWAALGADQVDPIEGATTARAGTINVVAFIPHALSPAALVNAAVTATEAKCQALLEAGVHATGTATDAVCICCAATGTMSSYGGPRSLWGARLARAVHAAVLAGAWAWAEAWS